MAQTRRSPGCIWLGLGGLGLCSCAAAGVGRAVDMTVPHDIGYASPLFSFGLLGCLCLILPALLAGVVLGLWRGNRLPAVTDEELGQVA